MMINIGTILAQFGKLLFASSVVLLLPAQIVYAANGGDTNDSYAPKRVAMNVRNYEVTPQVFYEAAYRALLKRGWKVETNEQTRLVGNLSEGDDLYKVEILYAGDIITVRFVEGYHHPFKRKWLKNLAVDIRQEILPLKKKAHVVPPAPTPAPSQ